MQDARMLCRRRRGRVYSAQVTNDWSDWRSDWMPTLEHFPVYKKDGGKAAVDNVCPQGQGGRASPAEGRGVKRDPNPPEHRGARAPGPEPDG